MFDEDYRNDPKRCFSWKVTGCFGIYKSYMQKKVGFVLVLGSAPVFKCLDILLWFRACMLPITDLILKRTRRL